MLNEFTHSTLGASADSARSGSDVHVLMIRGLARSLPWALLMVLVGAAAGLAIGLLQPNRFESTTKLMLRPGAREQITSESLVGLEGGHLASPPTMHDELQMLDDPAIFEHVAREIGPGEILDPADPEHADGPRVSAVVRWMHRLQAAGLRWLAGRRELEIEGDDDRLRLATKALTADTKIESEPGSNVIVITHTSTSPEKARKVAQALADAFIQRHREQFSIQSLVEACRVKLAHAKQSRDAAADAYLENVNHSGLPELDPQVPALLQEITVIEGELFAARVRKQAIGRQRNQLSGKLVDVPAEVEIPGPIVLVPNEEYETQLMLKRGLLTQKQNLALETRSIEEGRRIAQRLDQQIAAADEKLRQLPQRVAQNPELRENVAHSLLSTKVEDLDLEEQDVTVKLEALEQRLTEKRTTVADLRKKVLAETLRQKDLESQREAEEASYKQVLARYTVLEALGNIELHEQPNLRVLQAATLETEKIGPKRFSLVLKGFCAGLFLAMALAVMRQRFDRRLLRPEAVERAHGLPVLGVVPDVPALHRLPKQSVPRWN